MESNYAKWQKYHPEYVNNAATFLNLCKTIPQSQTEQSGACGKWSTRQLAGHITGWEKEVIIQFAKVAQGSFAPIRYKIDEFNLQAVESRSHLDWDQTVQELEQAQNDLQQFMNKLTETDINSKKRYLDWVKILAEHYKHHLGQLHKFLC